MTIQNLVPTLETRQQDTRRPDTPVVMYQKWRDLLFLHWAFRPEAIQRTLPPGLYVDTFDDHAWIGVIPFAMRDIRPRLAPPVPPISNLLEVNLRTYVFDDYGRSGVWFYSLDASSKIAVRLARQFFHLNYLHSRLAMARQVSAGLINIDYSCQRLGAPDNSEINISYSASECYLAADPGSIEYFFLERYALYAYDQARRRLFRGRVYHKPYLLAPAKLFLYDENLFELQGIPRPGRIPDSVIYSPGADVSIHALEPVS